jgi:peptidase E
MSTRLILHGGFNPENSQEESLDFYEEILKSAPENPKILLVPFAKDEDRIASAVEKVSNRFKKLQENVEISVANEKDFMNQIQLVDVVYFHGGASLKLLKALKKYPNLKQSLEGKLITGESAGANVWSTFFYSPKVDVVSEGLGFLPIKICPHYKEEYAGKLDDVGKDLESVLLREYEFRVFP